MKERHSIVFALALIIALMLPTLGRGGAAQTITFITAPWGVPPDQALFKGFQDRTGITVQVISAPSAEMYTKVQVASSGRRAPADVIFLTEEAPSFVVAPGYMEPLDAFVAKSPDLNVGDIERMDFWTVGGKVQGITTYVQLVMMDYNAKRLQAGGFNKPA
ncbi:MAG TPA: ABC transporter substrate-binding protein, partial [bacterium]|nr:ABC transporter substrate-binding protein [bacterium]